MRNDDYSKPIYSTNEIHCAVSMYTDFHKPHITWWGKLRLGMALRKAFREHEKLRKLESASSITTLRGKKNDREVQELSILDN